MSESNDFYSNPYSFHATHSFYSSSLPTIPKSYHQQYYNQRLSNLKQKIHWSDSIYNARLQIVNLINPLFVRYKSQYMTPLSNSYSCAPLSFSIAIESLEEWSLLVNPAYILPFEISPTFLPSYKSYPNLSAHTQTQSHYTLRSLHLSAH